MQKVSFFKSIHVKLVLIYVLLIIIALQIIGIYFSKQLETNLQTNFQDSIRQRIELVHYSVREEMLKVRDENTPPTIEYSLKTILEGFSTEDINKINVVDRNDRILATSDDDQTVVGQRINEEIIQQAASSETLLDKISLDRDTGQRIWILAVPIMDNAGPKEELKGVIYVQSNIEKVYEQLNEINRIFAAGIAVSLAITIILGILVARTITRPISDMRKQAQAMSKGNYARKVRVYGTDEIGQLAIAFNHLTNRLQEAQSTTEAERRKLASVLSNMTDGVIATDRKGKIILINDPALELLHDSRETTLNRPIASVLRLDQEYSFEDLIHMKDPVNLDFSMNDAPYVLRANFSVIQKETGFV
ncbi:MAG TPA: HAMP domain-containing protein, partial [Kurthia sp.]